MAEENITDDRVKKIEYGGEVDEPDDGNACFIGCIMVKEGLVSRFWNFFGSYSCFLHERFHNIFADG